MKDPVAQDPAGTPQAAAERPFPSLPLRSQQLSARKPTRFAFRPTLDERRAVADALGLIDLAKFTFVGEIQPIGRADFVLTAQLFAEALQPCSVTLAPVPARVEEPVRRRYDADFNPPDAEEAEMVDDETEPLPEVLDIAAIAAEALALALPLYPRASGAELGEAVFAAVGVAPLMDAELKPFAGLAGLAEKLKIPDSGSSSKG